MWSSILHWEADARQKYPLFDHPYCPRAGPAAEPGRARAGAAPAASAPRGLVCAVCGKPARHENHGWVLTADAGYVYDPPTESDFIVVTQRFPLTAQRERSRWQFGNQLVGNVSPHFTTFTDSFAAIFQLIISPSRFYEAKNPLQVNDFSPHPDGVENQSVLPLIVLFELTVTLVISPLYVSIFLETYQISTGRVRDEALKLREISALGVTRASSSLRESLDPRRESEDRVHGDEEAQVAGRR